MWSCFYSESREIAVSLVLPCVRTRWRDYISDLTWYRLGVKLEELSEIAVDRDFAILGLLPRDHFPEEKRV